MGSDVRPLYREDGTLDTDSFSITSWESQMTNPTDLKTFPFWTPGKRYVPDYYKWTVRDLNGTTFTFDIYELLMQMDTGPAFAAKHLLRGGRKKGVPLTQDISKALEELERFLELEARE